MEEKKNRWVEPARHAAFREQLNPNTNSANRCTCPQMKRRRLQIPSATKKCINKASEQNSDSRHHAEDATTRENARRSVLKRWEVPTVLAHAVNASQALTATTAREARKPKRIALLLGSNKNADYLKVLMSLSLVRSRFQSTLRT